VGNQTTSLKETADLFNNASLTRKLLKLGTPIPNGFFVFIPFFRNPPIARESFSIGNGESTEKKPLEM